MFTYVWATQFELKIVENANIALCKERFSILNAFSHECLLLMMQVYSFNHKRRFSMECDKYDHRFDHLMSIMVDMTNEQSLCFLIQ